MNKNNRISKFKFRLLRFFLKTFLIYACFSFPVNFHFLGLLPTRCSLWAAYKKIARKYHKKRAKRSKRKKYSPRYPTAQAPQALTPYLVPEKKFLYLIYRNILIQAANNIKYIESLSGILEKRETIGGELLPREIIEFAVDKQSLYMQWTGKVNHSRKLLFRPEMDKGQVWLKQPEGIWQALGLFQIDRDAKHLLSGNRHLFPRELKNGFWFVSILEFAQREIKLGQNQNGFKLFPVTLDSVDGRQCLVLSSTAPVAWVKEDWEKLPGRENQFYGLYGKIWLEKKSLVPLKVLIAGKGNSKVLVEPEQNLRILELYHFRNLQINQELANHDIWRRFLKAK